MKILFGERGEIKCVDATDATEEEYIGIASQSAFDIKIDSFKSFHDTKLWSRHPLMNSKGMPLENESPSL